MIVFINRFIANIKLRRKIIAVVILVVLIMVTSSALGLSLVVNNYNNLLYTAMAEALTPFVRETEANIQSVEFASSFLISDQNAQDTLEAFIASETQLEKNVTSKELYTTLYTQASINKYITAITILTNSGEVLTAYTNPMNYDISFYDNIAEAARKKEGRTVWLQSENNTGGIICARSIRKKRNLSLEELGVLIMHVDLEKMIRDAQSTAGSQRPTSIAIISQNDTIFANEGYDLAGMLPPDEFYGIRVLSGKKYFMVQRPAGSLGWIYMGYSPYNDIFQSIISAQSIFIAAVAVAVGISILVSTRMTKSIIRHFYTLGQKMDSFRNGNLTPLDVNYDYSWREDELGVLHRHYDQMLDSISDLIEDNYVKQLLIKDARIKTLEQQINPHFLYNTLNSIHWKAVAAGHQEISIMVQALAGMLRTALSEQADTIPLHRELEIVGDYIKIQTIRYEERLDYSQVIDPELLNLSVPKMSIQPLIENAIKYSLEEIVETCKIRLRIRKGDDTAVIDVSNSGSTIDEDILEKLAKNEIKPRGQGIGLTNIDARIKLLCGKQYGLRFYNKDDFTHAIIILPLTDKK